MRIDLGIGILLHPKSLGGYIREEQTLISFLLGAVLASVHIMGTPIGIRAIAQEGRFIGHDIDQIDMVFYQIV